MPTNRFVELPPMPHTGATVQELEVIIESSVDAARIAWVDAAKALREIQERQLYTYLCLTFEEYVETRFGRTRQWAYQLIQSVTTIASLSSRSDPPTVARHVRALGGLPPTQASAAWDAANAEARENNRAVTTIDVQAAVQRVRSGDSARVTSETVRQEQWIAQAVRIARRLSPDNLRRLIEQLRETR